MKQLLNKNRDKFNNLWLGLILAFILPIITFLLTWRVNYTDPLFDYISTMDAVNKLPSLISLSVIPNLLLFFIFIWLDRMKSSRGVLLMTMLYAFIMIILKFF